MGKSAIDWLSFPGYQPESWNVTADCFPESPGCAHCWAKGLAWRFCHNEAIAANYAGTVSKDGDTVQWTGAVNLFPERLDDPRHWRSPRAVFVCSQSDLWYERVPWEFIGKVYDLAASLPQHLFFFLTKRAENLLRWSLNHLAHRTPAPNCWFGMTVCNQEEANEKIPLLLQARVGHRYVSYEPALGPVDFTRYLWSATIVCKSCGNHFETWQADLCDGHPCPHNARSVGDCTCIIPDGVRSLSCPHCGACKCASIESWHMRGKLEPSHGRFEWQHSGLNWGSPLGWIIAGAESGKARRRAENQWFYAVAEQCEEARVPFFLKQMDVDGELVKVPILSLAQFPEVQ